MNSAEIQENVIRVVESVSRNVVQIKGRKYSNGRSRDPHSVEIAASGIIMSSSGYVVTNNHVVDEALETEVIFPDGSSYEAELVGSDAPTDLALLKTDARGMLPAKFTDSENIKAGQFAIAVGNALGLPGAPSVSLGVISAVERPMPWSDFIFEGLIQTDAAINPGNSGGPLVDLSGNVIGINTAMIPFAQGVGFAIPSNTVSRVVEQILDTGRVTRPWLGISGISINPNIAKRFRINAKNGIMVLRLTPHGPADRAGFEVYDTITAVNGNKVNSMRDLLSGLAMVKIGEGADFSLIRGNRSLSLHLALEEMPEPYIETISGMMRP